MEGEGGEVGGDDLEPAMQPKTPDNVLCIAAAITTMRGFKLQQLPL